MYKLDFLVINEPRAGLGDADKIAKKLGWQFLFRIDPVGVLRGFWLLVCKAGVMWLSLLTYIL